LEKLMLIHGLIVTVPGCRHWLRTLSAKHAANRGATSVDLNLLTWDYVDLENSKDPHVHRRWQDLKKASAEATFDLDVLKCMFKDCLKGDTEMMGEVDRMVERSIEVPNLVPTCRALFASQLERAVNSICEQSQDAGAVECEFGQLDSAAQDRLLSLLELQMTEDAVVSATISPSASRAGIGSCGATINQVQGQLQTGYKSRASITARSAPSSPAASLGSTAALVLFVPPSISPTQAQAQAKSRGSSSQRSGGWTAEEDTELLAALAKFPPGETIKWSAVATEVYGRSRIQCRQRWNMVLQPGKAKGPWKAHEDEALRAAVTDEHNKQPVKLDWNRIASKVAGREKMQVRDRWENHLDPTIIKGPFTLEEDATLVRLQAAFGNKFAKIAREMPGRPLVQVKIRWRSMQRAAARKLRTQGL